MGDLHINYSCCFLDSQRKVTRIVYPEKGRVFTHQVLTDQFNLQGILYGIRLEPFDYVEANSDIPSCSKA